MNARALRAQSRIFNELAAATHEDGQQPDEPTRIGGFLVKRQAQLDRGFLAREDTRALLGSSHAASDPGAGVTLINRAQATKHIRHYPGGPRQLRTAVEGACKTLPEYLRGVVESAAVLDATSNVNGIYRVALIPDARLTQELRDETQHIHQQLGFVATNNQSYSHRTSPCTRRSTTKTART
jgi:hypothetical protein